jgi:uncharacterized repeat protein (TIGR01451 family)
MRYCILVTNIGTQNATSVTASDPLPSNVSYVAGSMLSGTNCAGAATPEDEGTAGTDESDPVGMSLTGTTVAGITPSLAPGGSIALVFTAMIN